MVAASTPAQIVVRRPVRGGVWGLLLGLSLALWALLYKLVAFGDWLILGLLVLAGILIGVLWAMFAPPKKPIGPPPGQVGGGYVPVQQAPPVAQAPVQQAQPAQPGQPGQPGQPEYAPMSGMPGGAPPAAPAAPVVPDPAPAPPDADDLQPSFLVEDPEPPQAPASPPPSRGGPVRDTVVARPDDQDGGGDGGAFSQRS